MDPKHTPRLGDLKAAMRRNAATPTRPIKERAVPAAQARRQTAAMPKPAPATPPPQR